MRNKKLFNRLMAVVMCSTLMTTTPIMTYATEVGTESVEETLQTVAEPQADENGFVIENGVLTDYVGTAEHVVVPEGVTEIQWSAFEGNDTIISVKLPSIVEKIGSNAFHGCNNLESIELSSALLSIGHGAFTSCISLKSIELLENVKTIGMGAFAGCSSLEKIVIPDTVTEIGYGAFAGKYEYENADKGLEGKLNAVFYVKEGSYAQQYAEENGFTFEVIKEEFVVKDGVLIEYNGDAIEVTIPDGVTSIGPNAFEGCIDLKQVIIPDSVMSIGAYAFNGCSGLTEITIPNGVTTLGRCTFYGCTSLKQVIIPDTMVNIMDRVFTGCTSLTKVVIPDGVKCIGEYAFSGCNGLTEVIIPNSVTSLGESSFSECSQLTEITIPNSETYIGESAFYGCNELTIFCVKDSFAHQYAVENGFEFKILGEEDNETEEFVVEDGVLVRYKGDATEVTIPSNVIMIGSLAFENCSTVKKVIVPGTVKTIKEKAFIGCDNLERIILEEGVETIEDYGLAKSSELKIMDSLRELVIPSSVKSIGTNAIQGMKGFPSGGENTGHEIYVNKGSYAEEYVSNLGYILSGQINVIYENGSVIRNGNRMVGYRGESSSVSIPENVKYINYSAFRDCAHVSEITFPTGIEYIQVGAFDGTAWLESLRAKSALIMVDNYLIDGKSATGEVTIPENITLIADGAFRENNNITKVIIPSGVTELGCEVFYQCENLKEVVIPLSVTYIETIDPTWYGAFDSVSKDLVIYGEEGSYAQKFAEENNFTFKVLGQEDSEKPEIPEKPKTPIYNQEQFDKLLGENSTSDTVIEANDKITITFGKGTMKEVDGVTSYDFTATTTNDYKASKLPTSVKENEFVLKISYNYSGNLPAEASIEIFVGTEYAGKTLYYSLLKEDGTLTETQNAVVNADGYMTVKQKHCSDWVITTTNPNPTSENTGNNTGNSDNKAPDTGEDNVWITNILLVLPILFLGICKKRKRA